jgi:hypothetical protein
MQIETTIIAMGLLAGWISTAFFLVKAAKKAHARGVANGFAAASELHTQEVQGLRQDLHRQIALRKADRARYQPACTLADHELLTNVGSTLRLAEETWQAFPGAESMVKKANQQQRELIAFAAKMWVSTYPTQPMVEDAA